MIVTLLSWAVMFVLSGLIGRVFIYFVAPKSFVGTSKSDVYVVAGLLFLNVYAQIYSIFANVGRRAFYLIVIIAILCMFYNYVYINKRCPGRIKSCNVQVWQLCVIFFTVTFVGLCTMKAPTHVDTYLYHAQAIRWIEEYGVVPGLGNLHNRFAYNSAFMALQALFSFAWFFEQPLHSVNGFFGCFLTIYALITNKFFTKNESRLSDFLKLVIIVYVYVNRNNISSPSDISAMLLVLYISCKWSECIESEEKDSQSFGFICLIAAWAVSIKLSTAPCLILLLYPAAMLLREKRWKTILLDLVCGITIVAPWLIRNVIISGYILYPYSEIDLFRFDWKMPAEVLDYDRKEIIVWGREVRDVSKFDESIFQWFDTWYSGQIFRNKMFIIIGFSATIVILVLAILKLVGRIRKRNYVKFFSPNAEEGLLITTIITSEIFWLFSAPLLRYGMVYLLMPAAIIAFAIKEFIGEYTFRKCMSIGTIFLICVLFLYKDEEFRVVMPHGYWKMDNVKNEWHGYEIYSPVEDTLSGYYDFPAVTKESILENIVPRGSKIEEGFRAK